MLLSEPIHVTLQVAQALEILGIPYFIGGSLASAVHGVPRSTIDTDLVAVIRLEQAHLLAQALEKHFYVQVDDIREAIIYERSFNVIHLETFFKVDVFIAKTRPYDHEQLRRRIAHVVTIEPEQSMYIASAEDTVLAKLEWYRMGNGISDRQWSDILGVLKMQSDILDKAYMRHWAKELGVLDLLERALEDAG